jgi:hypothetical protein
MIKFTEVEALSLTVNQWQWMLNNPARYKRDWTGWDTNELPNLKYKGSGIFGNCFLCHYYHTCLGCPLLGANARCDTHWGWINGDIPARRNLASSIIEKCEDRLKELGHA